MIKLKSLLKEYRKAVILSPSKAKKLIATIKKQERVSKVFKHKATYDGKMTTIYSIRARNKSHYSGNNPYGLDMSRDSKGGSYLIRVNEGKIKPKLKITKKEWSKTHKDYKTVIDGVHYVMKLTNKGTALVPVIVEGKLTEGKETLVATGKDKRGKKIEMFKTVRWGGMVTHILKSNGKEFDQYAPNLKGKVALKQFKKDYKNIKIEKS